MLQKKIFFIIKHMIRELNDGFSIGGAIYKKNFLLAEKLSHFSDNLISFLFICF